MASRRYTWFQALVAVAAVLLSIFLIHQQWQQYFKQAISRTSSEPAAWFLRNISTVDNARVSPHHARAPPPINPYPDKPGPAGLPPKPKPEDYAKAWDKAVAIGTWLICMMNRGALDVQWSKYRGRWDNTDDLTKYGWIPEIDPQDGEPLSDLPLHAVWQALGIDVPAAADSDDDSDNGSDKRSPKNWAFVKWEHSRATTHTLENGQRKNYPATGAPYDNYLNLKDGVIVASYNFGPEFFVDDDFPVEDIVPLRKWSDIMFLTWKMLNPNQASGAPNNNMGNLKHVIQHLVINDDSILRMKEVLQHKFPDRPFDDPAPLWPGVTFRILDEGAKALMNSPNANGVAWLLGQHKEEMGIRVVDKITIFSTRNDYDEPMWNLYFHIVQGPLRMNLADDDTGD